MVRGREVERIEAAFDCAKFVVIVRIECGEGGGGGARAPQRAESVVETGAVKPAAPVARVTRRIWRIIVLLYILCRAGGIVGHG